VFEKLQQTTPIPLGWSASTHALLMLLLTAIAMMTVGVAGALLAIRAKVVGPHRGQHARDVPGRFSASGYASVLWSNMSRPVSLSDKRKTFQVEDLLEVFELRHRPCR
jgi:hypothetical protein